MRNRFQFLLLTLFWLLAACRTVSTVATAGGTTHSTSSDVAAGLAKYTTVRLAVDSSMLTPNERRMLPLLMDAADAMDEIYWHQAHGHRDSLMSAVGRDSAMRRFVEINYGPWDRLANDRPFVPGAAPKSPGANYYPHDMTKGEFEATVADGPKARADSLRSLYTLVRRDAAGRLVAIPFAKAYAPLNNRAAGGGGGGAPAGGGGGGGLVGVATSGSFLLARARVPAAEALDPHREQHRDDDDDHRDHAGRPHLGAAEPAQVHVERQHPGGVARAPEREHEDQVEGHHRARHDQRRGRDDRVLELGQRDREELAHPAGAVDPGGLVQRRRDLAHPALVD
jgi:hypothetical protein